MIKIAWKKLLKVLSSGWLGWFYVISRDLDIFYQLYEPQKYQDFMSYENQETNNMTKLKLQSV